MALQSLNFPDFINNTAKNQYLYPAFHCQNVENNGNELTFEIVLVSYTKKVAQFTAWHEGVGKYVQ